MPRSDFSFAGPHVDFERAGLAEGVWLRRQLVVSREKLKRSIREGRVSEAYFETVTDMEGRAWRVSGNEPPIIGRLVP